MPIDIHGLPPPRSPQIDSGAETRQERKGSKPDAAAATPTTTDIVNLTGVADRLRHLVDQVSSLPVVDEKRIETIREAIERGRYEVDAERTAEKLLAFERKLLERK